VLAIITMNTLSTVCFTVAAIALFVNIGGSNAFLMIEMLPPLPNSSTQACPRRQSPTSVSTSVNVSSLISTRNSIYTDHFQNFHRAKVSNDDDDDGSSPKGTSSVEDGSPLGVAIVVVGGFLTLQLEEKTDSVAAWDESYIWVVFCTASIAAGLSRLVRYFNTKRNE